MNKTDNTINERKRIGRMLANVRESRRVTVEELAERTGLGVNNISRVESGLYNVPLDVLTTMCEALEVRLELV